MSFLDELLEASWRGVPFHVRASEYPRGRRVALHEYAFRDKAWVQDVGRATRITSFSGFLIGDAVNLYAQVMRLACEKKGPGTLVHPSIGVMTCSLLEVPRFSERADQLRVVEIAFVFAETTSNPTYPNAGTDTQGAVGTAASSGSTSFLGDVGKTLDSAISAGSEVLSSVQDTVGGLVDTVTNLPGGPLLMAGAVSGLSPVLGSFGRYAGGTRSTASNAASIAAALATTTDARQAVSQAGAAVTTAAGAL